MAIGIGNRSFSDARVRPGNFTRLEIQADPTLSTTAKEIEVVTLNAQTTLRGHVNSVEGKQRIGEIAAKSGRAENVSNLLEVRPPLTETVDLGSHLRKW